jgi:hypothetical protein
MSSSGTPVTLPSSIISRLTHEVTLLRMDGNTVLETVELTIKGTTDHVVYVTPGFWHISAVSLLDGEKNDIFAEGGSGGVTVELGRSTPANLEMVLEYILIRNKEDLKKLADYTDSTFPLNKKYIVTSPINLSGENWTPIGQEPDGATLPFMGIFDGNDQIISNLTINSIRGYQGLFGIVGPASGTPAGIVRNVRLERVNITITGIIEGQGSLAGSNNIGGLIQNCSAKGTIISDAGGVGGLVGHNFGTIQNSHADVNITVPTFYGGIGGLVGLNSGNETPLRIARVQNSHAIGKIDAMGGFIGGLIGNNSAFSIVENCYATGEVGGGNRVGGLVGQNEPTSRVEYSYATGTVNGNMNIGGLVGQNLGAVQNSYASGNVGNSDTFNQIGGLVGRNDGGEVENSYATGNVSGNNPVGGLVGENDSGSIIKSSYATGIVNGLPTGNHVGGLVGLNRSSTIQNSVALNPSIRSNDSSVGRILGWDLTGDLINNYGRYPIVITYGTVPVDHILTPGFDTIDGANISASQWNSALWWQSLFPASAWVFRDGLPTLRDMPGGAQNPQVK